MKTGKNDLPIIGKNVINGLTIKSIKLSGGARIRRLTNTVKVNAELARIRTAKVNAITKRAGGLINT